MCNPNALELDSGNTTGCLPEGRKATRILMEMERMGLKGMDLSGYGTECVSMPIRSTVHNSKVLLAHMSYSSGQKIP
jgi:hypothetical protein